MKCFASILTLGIAGVLSVGCVVDNSSSTEVSSAGQPVPNGGSTSGTSSLPPMLVDVDPNVTMTATPGNGVGVFTEYASGGHWHIWWTCDTNQTTQNCAFDVKVSPSTGTLANAASQGFQTGDSLSQNPDGSIEAVTTTGLGVDGIHVDAPPGTPITLNASIGGMRDGSFLFFVQRGEVNGGFTGTLTDPLMLEGASP